MRVAAVALIGKIYYIPPSKCFYNYLNICFDVQIELAAISCLRNGICLKRDRLTIPGIQLKIDKHR